MGILLEQLWARRQFLAVAWMHTKFRVAFSGRAACSTRHTLVYHTEQCHFHS